MKKLVRSLFAGAAIAMPIVMVTASPAAALDAFVITGSGTISPGLTAVPTPQSVSFTGTATSVGTTAVPGSYPCSFSGTDTLGSAAEGVGTVSGSCGPFAFTNCQFVRIVGVVVVVCPPQGNPPRTAVAVCAFQPTNVNPTTRYNLVCAGVVGP
ncbi:MAG TPA: hypothetical protein VF519_15765 [Mycobacteriales bacterium]